MKKNLFILIITTSIIVAFFNNCGAGLEPIHSENTIQSIFKVNNKSTKGSYRTRCKDTSAMDGGPVSSSFDTLHISEVSPEANSNLNFKLYSNTFSDRTCEEQLTSSKLISSGTIKINNNNLDITVTQNTSNYSSLTGLDTNQTLYTSIELDSYSLNFVKTKSTKGQHPNSRLTFDMIEPVDNDNFHTYSYNVAFKRLVVFYPEEEEQNYNSYVVAGTYIGENSCPDLNQVTNSQDILTTISQDKEFFEPNKSEPSGKLIGKYQLTIYGLNYDIPAEKFYDNFKTACLTDDFDSLQQIDSTQFIELRIDPRYREYSTNQQNKLQMHNPKIQNTSQPPVPLAGQYIFYVIERELECKDKKVYIEYRNDSTELRLVPNTITSNQEILEFARNFCSEL